MKTTVCHYNSICGLNLHELCLCNVSLFTYRLSKLLCGKHQIFAGQLVRSKWLSSTFNALLAPS